MGGEILPFYSTKTPKGAEVMSAIKGFPTQQKTTQSRDKYVTVSSAGKDRYGLHTAPKFAYSRNALPVAIEAYDAEKGLITITDHGVVEGDFLRILKPNDKYDRLEIPILEILDANTFRIAKEVLDADTPLIIGDELVFLRSITPTTDANGNVGGGGGGGNAEQDISAMEVSPIVVPAQYSFSAQPLSVANTDSQTTVFYATNEVPVFFNIATEGTPPNAFGFAVSLNRDVSASQSFTAVDLTADETAEEFFQLINRHAHFSASRVGALVTVTYLYGGAVIAPLGIGDGTIANFPITEIVMGEGTDSQSAIQELTQSASVVTGDFDLDYDGNVYQDYDALRQAAEFLATSMPGNGSVQIDEALNAAWGETVFTTYDLNNLNTANRIYFNDPGVMKETIQVVNNDALDALNDPIIVTITELQQANNLSQIVGTPYVRTIGNRIATLRQDVLAPTTGEDGDAEPLKSSALGEVYVKDVTAIQNLIGINGKQDLIIDAINNSQNRSEVEFPLMGSDEWLTRVGGDVLNNNTIEGFTPPAPALNVSDRAHHKYTTRNELVVKNVYADQSIKNIRGDIGNLATRETFGQVEAGGYYLGGALSVNSGNATWGIKRVAKGGQTYVAKGPIGLFTSLTLPVPDDGIKLSFSGATENDYDLTFFSATTNTEVLVIDNGNTGQAAYELFPGESVYLEGHMLQAATQYRIATRDGAGGPDQILRVSRRSI